MSIRDVEGCIIHGLTVDPDRKSTFAGLAAGVVNDKPGLVENCQQSMIVY
jgi:hypothetical protein